MRCKARQGKGRVGSGGLYMRLSLSRTLNESTHFLVKGVRECFS